MPELGNRPNDSVLRKLPFPMTKYEFNQYVRDNQLKLIGMTVISAEYRNTDGSLLKVKFDNDREMVHL